MLCRIFKPMVLVLFILGMISVCQKPVLAQSIAAQDYSPELFTPEQLEEYEKQLNALLRTSRTEEKEFIGKVVDQIQDRKIPSKLVSTSYQWIRKKRPNTSYRFIYFEKVLRLQAKAIDLEDEIPPFDFSIYKSAGQRVEGQQQNVGQIR